MTDEWKMQTNKELGGSVSEEEINNDVSNKQNTFQHESFHSSSSYEDFLTESCHQKLSLTWRDLTVFVPNKTLSGNEWYTFGKKKLFSETHKRVLNNVSGAIFPGTLLAILGASGSGKTTLMSVLSGRQEKNVVIGGQLFLNGEPLFENRQMDYIGFVFQEDLMFGTLTVKEHLNFMATLKMSKTFSSSEIQQRIEDLLIELNLKQCEGTKIGIPGIFQGISGGEKKRLAFATEILTDPPILFCDEPTSGLDSFMAQSVIAVLKNMASNGRTVVCSIHQPSSEVFAMFNRVMLLADGRTAFFGTKEDAEDFFTKQNLPCPPNFNPADHYIQSVANDPSMSEFNKRKIRRICDNFHASEYGKNLERQISFTTGRRFYDLNDKYSQNHHFRYNASWLIQLKTLIWRGIYDSYRNPSIALIRLGQKIFLALILSAFYFHIPKNQKGIFDTLGAIYLFLTENTFSNLYGVLNTFSGELPIFHREHKNRLYRTDTYYVAKILTMIPIFIIEPTVFILITYWLIGLNDSPVSFLITWSIIILTANISSACGCCFSAMFESLDMALTVLIGLDYLLMIGGGTFIMLNTLPSYLSWTQYLSWFKYGNEGINIAVWKGVKNITCEWGPDAPCIKTGQEVLASRGYSPDHLISTIVSLVALYCFFHLIGFLSLLRQSRK